MAYYIYFTCICICPSFVIFQDNSGDHIEDCKTNQNNSSEDDDSDSEDDDDAHA